jgi:hypothetical protein
MKNFIVVILLLVLIGNTKSFAQAVVAQTEEYAIVDVFEAGKRKYIRTTVGTEPAVEKEWEEEKTAVRGDFTPVIEELNKLNLRGFELLNMSTTYSTISGGTYAAHGTPRFTFMMVKRLKEK